MYDGSYVCSDLNGEGIAVKYQVTVPGSGSLSGGAIAGIVIGCLALILIIVFLVWFFVFHKSKDGDDQSYYSGAEVE